MVLATPEQRIPGVPLPIDVSKAPASSVSVGRYRILAQLGEGAMANVYLGHSAGVGGFGRFFAIKILREQLIEKREWKHKFLDEARLAASIHHPYVVPVFEVGIDKDRYYFAMEYIRGETLDHLLRRCAKIGAPLQRHLVAHLIAQVADGLHAAHELRDASGRLLDVVHRDAVPRNILVGFDGIARLGDFGIASAVDKRSRTEPGMMHGTISYSAPEYLQDQKSDRRTDIFTLGVVLFEATTGLRLFRRSRDVETLKSVLEAKVPLPSSIVRDYPPELEAIVLRALQRDPADRQQTAQELADALRVFVATTVSRTDLTAELRRTMLDVFAARYAERMELEARARGLLEDPEAGTDTPLVSIPSFTLTDSELPELMVMTPKPEVETLVGPPSDILETIEIQETSPIDVDFALDPEVTVVPPPAARADTAIIRDPLPRASTPRTPTRPITPPPVRVSIEIGELPLDAEASPARKTITSTMVVRRRMIPRIKSGIDAPPIESTGAPVEEDPTPKLERSTSAIDTRPEFSQPAFTAPAFRLPSLSKLPVMKPTPARGGAIAAAIAVLLSALFLGARQFAMDEPAVTAPSVEISRPSPPPEPEPRPRKTRELAPRAQKPEGKPKRVAPPRAKQKKLPPPQRRAESWDPLDSQIMFGGKDL